MYGLWQVLKIKKVYVNVEIGFTGRGGLVP